MMGQKDGSAAGKPGIGRRLLLVIGVIAVIALIVVAGSVLSFPFWVVFLGLCTWTALGVEIDLKKVTLVWLSFGLGVFNGYLFTNMAQLGTWALAVGLALALVLLWTMATHGKLGFLFNAYYAIFLTAATVHGAILEPVPLVKAWIFGYLLLGILPCALVALGSRKKAAAVTDVSGS